ncbi:hypothetical protein ACP3VU_19495 [Vibrio sp. PNB23_22_6]|uniref:hypothetical protein n=1 Tax=Vibrio TaxID=662 RepID=UPI0040685D61
MNYATQIEQANIQTQAEINGYVALLHMTELDVLTKIGQLFMCGKQELWESSKLEERFAMLKELI